VDDVVVALAQMMDGKIVVGGNFHNAGGSAAAHVATWSGSAWAALGSGLDDACFCLAANPVANRVWAGGAFHTAGGVTVNHIARWDGSSAVWQALGVGVNAPVYAIAYHLVEGVWYAGGLFTSAGYDTFARKLAVWNGAAWTHCDIDISSTYYVLSLYVDSAGYLYVTTDALSSVTIPGSTVVTNGGTTTARPVITVNRSGGTLATLAWIRNETTGQTLALDYDLLDGETLTIDLANHTIWSSVFGNRLDALMPGSEFANWALAPGANVIAAWVEVTGGATVTAEMLWRDVFWSQD
jgi:hypothetical protein